MVQFCCFPKCTSKKGQNISTFGFPKNEVMLKKWISELQKSNCNYTNKVSHRICEKHFKSSDIIQNNNLQERQKLKLDAVPLNQCENTVAKLKSFHDNHGHIHDIVCDENTLPPMDIDNNEPWRLTLKRSSTPMTYKNKCYKNNSSVKLDVMEQCKHLSDSGYKDLSFSLINEDNPNETENDLYINIYNNLKSIILPELFTFQIINDNKTIVAFSSFLFSQHLQMVIPNKQIILHQNLNTETIIFGIKYSTNQVTSIEELTKLIINTDHKSVCEGLNNISLSSTSRSPYVKDLFGKVRHQKCSLLLDKSRTENKLCLHCKRIKTNERKKHSRPKVISKRINMQVSPQSKSKLFSLRQSMYKSRKRQIRVKKRLNLLEDELKECKNTMNNQHSIDEQNLPETHKTVVQEIFKASKHHSKKGMRYSEDWILKCLLFHIRSASGYNYIRPW